jgi:hypothetical protein
MLAFKKIFFNLRIDGYSPTPYEYALLLNLTTYSFAAHRGIRLSRGNP